MVLVMLPMADGSNLAGIAACMTRAMMTVVSLRQRLTVLAAWSPTLVRKY